MQAHNEETIKKALEDILANEHETIRYSVAEEALSSSYESPTLFFNDLLSHGCKSGMIGFLIYYTQTHAFYDKHYDEIEDLRLDYEESV